MMGKEKIKEILDLAVRKSKIVFPILVIVIVAATVAFGLKANRNKENADSQPESNSSSESSTVESSTVESGSAGNVLESVENLITEMSSQATAEPTEEPVVSEDVPLMPNEDPAIYSVAAYYYNSMAIGDTETLLALYDELSEVDLLFYEQTANYLDYYTALDVYSKPGPVEGSTLAYVYYKVCFKNHTDEFPGYQTLYICTDENGELYIKNESNFTEDEIEYIKKVSSQADVVDFYNRVTVEFDEMLVANPDLLEYLSELGTSINVAIGDALARVNAENGGDTGENTGESSGETEVAPTQEPVVENVVQYATAITTVNVRSSDSEQADKLGKISTGTRIQVQEIRVNGWTKVLYEGKDGYIKSEFLQMEESAEGLAVIGTVTATTTINIRSEASQSSTKLGVLTEGSSLELVEVVDGWCKVIYNGQVAYVKADYVTQE